LPSATYDSTGEGHVVWVNNNDLAYRTLSGSASSGVRPSSSSASFYEVELMTNSVGNLTLVWTEGVDNGPANIFARIYDPARGVWSADRRLSEDSALAQNVDGFFGADGKIYLAYLSTVINRVSQNVSFPGGATAVIPNIPQDGQTDLRVLDHSLITDLAVVDKDLSISPVDPVAGSEVNATLNVHNGGDFAADAFTVKLYVGDPSAGGLEVGSQKVSGPFVAGGVSSLDFTFTYPATTANIIAVVDTDNTITEFSEANNRATYHLTNSPPEARILAPVTTGTVPLTVNLDATTSSDANGDALVYSWAFGDNTASAAGGMVSHTFTQRGAYPVTLVATDAKGAVGTAVVWINVGLAFADVPANGPFYTEITKLSARGVTLGCGNGNYCPNNPVTREQMAAFLVRAFNY
jgi:PKD repeat protein